ncbi:MAG TPA: L-threonylcarbamoyladenylate synthase, partial [Egibacteraceae bacterium]|nr:L-threonylcarbamoyladenylate synthase [Egibacteraceae bacterium]
MEVLRVERDRPAPAAIASAAAVLRAGGLVAFPTETVYGLGADARREDAVRAVFAAKGRPADNPLIVHVADAAGLGAVAASVPPLAARLAERFWPGPLTLVVDAAPAVPAVTTGGLATVAVRVPDHPVALALLRAADLPVAAPSANRSGRPSPTTGAHVVEDLAASGVALLLDAGPSGIGIESTVVDARGAAPVVLREGAISREDLGGALVAQGSPASPGTRYRHYAPACRVELVARGQGRKRA